MGDVQEHFHRCQRELYNLQLNKRCYLKQFQKEKREKTCLIGKLRQEVHCLSRYVQTVKGKEPVKPEKSARKTVEDSFKALYPVSTSRISLLRRKCKAFQAEKEKKLSILSQVRESIEVTKSTSIQKQRDMGGMNAIEEKVKAFKRQKAFYESKISSQSVRVNSLLGDIDHLREASEQLQDECSLKEKRLLGITEELQGLKQVIGRKIQAINSVCSEAKEEELMISELRKKLEAVREVEKQRARKVEGMEEELVRCLTVALTLSKRYEVERSCAEKSLSAAPSMADLPSEAEKQFEQFRGVVQQTLEALKLTDFCATPVMTARSAKSSQTEDSAGPSEAQVVSALTSELDHLNKVKQQAQSEFLKVQTEGSLCRDFVLQGCELFCAEGEAGAARKFGLRKAGLELTKDRGVVGEVGLLEACKQLQDAVVEHLGVGQEAVKECATVDAMKSRVDSTRQENELFSYKLSLPSV